jgi:hypothetical protein
VEFHFGEFGIAVIVCVRVVFVSGNTVERPARNAAEGGVRRRGLSILPRGFCIEMRIIKVEIMGCGSGSWGMGVRTSEVTTKMIK